ncbi:hypothetical protein OIV83_002430 [Microbotryomycetes sp. JL201]|nr:hypothetical protein OIV83_002430 [Microbotryomycetes sp. JL201]
MTLEHARDMIPFRGAIDNADWVVSLWRGRLQARHFYAFFRLLEKYGINRVQLGAAALSVYPVETLNEECEGNVARARQKLIDWVYESRGRTPPQLRQAAKALAELNDKEARESGCRKS